MAHSLRDLDAWITGDFLTENPANQPDEQSESEIDNLEDAIKNGDTFLAIMILEDIRLKTKALRDYSKNNENVYLEKRLTEIYNLL